MENKLKLSAYLFKNLYHIKRHQLGLFFSGRTAKNIFVSANTYNSVINEDFRHIDKNTMELLIKAKVLVPKEEDEFRSINIENQKILKKQRQYHSEHLYMSIQPTDKCQFACNYCGQEHNHAEISIDTIECLIKQIDIKLSAHDYQDMEIGWFGGEPLCALDKMRIINKHIKILTNKHKIKNLSHITTNGYILTPDVYRELKEQFNCRRIEITIDGDKEFHDKHRFTCSGKGTFVKLYNNLKSIVSSPYYDKTKCMITIRCNIDQSNIDGVIPLLHKLYNDGMQDKIRFYCACVVSWANNGAGDAKTWKIIGKKSTEYILYMLTHGFRTEILPHRSGPYICIGTMKESLMYDAYGNIYDCSETAYSTRYLGDPLHLGNIHNRGNKRKNSALATIPHMLLSGQIKQCKDCKYYPLCGGLCPLALYEKEPRCPMFIYNIEDRMLINAIYRLNHIK